MDSCRAGSVRFTHISVAYLIRILYFFNMKSSGSRGYSRFGILLSLFLITGLVSVAEAVIYNPGDWVDYTNFRYVTSVAADNDVVYFGTTGGIIRYDRFADKWLDPITTVNGLPSNVINELAYDLQYDDLWVITDRGTGKYNITFENWYDDDNFPQNLVINEWNPSAFPTLFVPFRYNYNNGVISDPNLQSFQITVGYNDDFDYQLYVGTWGMGTGVINTDHIEFTPLTYGPYNYNIYKIVAIDKSLWFGNDYSLADRAITNYSMAQKQWSYFQPQYITGLGETEITSGIRVGNNTWLGSTTGLIQVTKDGGFRTLQTFAGLPSDAIYSLAQYGNYIYVGTDDGLGILSSKGALPDSSFKAPLTGDYLLRGHTVYSLLVHDSTLYIATEYKVYAYNSSQLQFRDLDTPANDLSWGATDIFSDGAYLYFAGRFGVVVVDPATDSSWVATDPSLNDRWVLNELYCNPQFIFAATNLGLWKYRRDDQVTYLYTTADGLPVNEVNSVIGDGNYLWLGTDAGLIRFFWNSPGRGD